MTARGIKSMFPVSVPQLPTITVVSASCGPYRASVDAVIDMEKLVEDDRSGNWGDVCEPAEVLLCNRARVLRHLCV